MIDIERLNYLAKKSKIEGLTDEEKAEQAAIRREYIDSVKASLKASSKNTPSPYIFSIIFLET